MVTINRDYDLSSITISKDDVAQLKTARNNEKFESDFLDTASVYKRLDENPKYYTDMLIFIDGHCKEFLPKERNVIAMLASNKFISDKQSKIARKQLKKLSSKGLEYNFMMEILY